MQETLTTCDGCRETTNAPLNLSDWCIVNPVEAKRARDEYYICSDRKMHFCGRCSEEFGLPKSVGVGVFGLLKKLAAIVKR